MTFNFENKKGLPKGFDLGTQLTFNNRGTFYFGKYNEQPAYIQVTNGFEDQLPTGIDESNPNNKIKVSNCKQSFYRNSPNKSEETECQIINQIYNKKIKITEPFEYETTPAINSLFECKDSKKTGNFRYLVYEGEENFVPISTKIASLTLQQSIKVMKELLIAIVQISSQGMNAANLPYSHSNINANNVLVNEDNAVRVVNFASAVACKDIRYGIPLNNSIMYSPPEQSIFEFTGSREAYVKDVENKIKKGEFECICDKNDVWAAGVLFLDLITLNKASSTFKIKHQSFISQELGIEKSVNDFLKLKEFDQKTLFETLGLVEADIFAGDEKQVDKTKALYEFIKKIMAPEPAKRPTALDLLKEVIFEKGEEVAAAATY